MYSYSGSNMKKLVRASLVVASGILLMGSSGSAATVFSTTLLGSNEEPPTSSTGTGFVMVTLNGNTLDLSAVFSGLSSPDIAAHIHCCGPSGTNESIALPFTSLPTGVTSGSFTEVFDLTNSAVYSSAFLGANGGTAASAEIALIAGLNADEAYANIHTSNFPGGEIRGQLAATPEPSTLLLGGIAFVGFALLRRKLFL